jgi:outer membrane protein assembly factor BamB
MRFSVDGPETLKAAGIALYGAETVGTPDLDVFVWATDLGFPDLSTVIYSTTVANGDLVYYPTYLHLDLSAENIVMYNDFHIGWSTNDVTGGTLAGLSDDGSCGTLRSSEYWGTWATMLADWGADVNFLIYADMCKDEFSVCQTESDYCGLAYFWRLPDRYGDVGNYQKIPSTGIGCRLEKVRIALYAGPGALYTYNSEVQVWTSDGPDGLPGTKIAYITVTPADYVLYPAKLEVDFTPMNVLFDEDVWVGIESLAPDTLTGIRTLSDNGSCGDRASCEQFGGMFGYMIDDWGGDYNFVLEADVCCIPPEERACTPGEDWPTSGHDFRRTAASLNSTGDAKCKQDVLWDHYDGNGFVYSRPIIYDTVLVVAYNNGKLQGFGINSATLMWTITGIANGINTGFRNSVTVQDGFVYYGGGSLAAFSKADVYTGTIIWKRSPTTANGLNGNTDYTTSVILDDIVYVPTANGALYALDAATGLNYAGWTTNPIMLDGNPQQTLGSNGVDELYIGTNGAFGTGYGTLYAVDAATGAINWSLGEADLVGQDLDGDTTGTTTEIFQGPIGCDIDGALYAMTAFEVDAVAGAPSGAYYKFTSGGAIAWAKAGRFPRYTGPVIDANAVYMSSLRGWTSEPLTTPALNKNSGAIIWESDPAYNAQGWVEGALSCEPFLPDLLYLGNTDGQFLALNTDAGLSEFEYQYVVTVSNRGTGIAIDPTHVVLTNRQGDIYVLTEQVDRPRLRIMKDDEYISVPFFSPNGYIVTYTDVFMNNGCADLTFTLTADENPAAYVSTVQPERVTRMNMLANSMVDNDYPSMAASLVKTQPVGTEIETEFTESAYSKNTYSNTAAYAPPSWLNSIVVSGGTLAGGETFSVSYNVNGPLVQRGAQRCYVTIASNDQYYLNSADNPVVQLGVIGGCLESFDDFVFGETEQNVGPLTNTGEIGNQDQTLWDIDGNSAFYWQGGFMFALDTYRLAFNLESWHGADPADFWNMLLPDPNCFDQCAPYITPDPVVLGQILDGGSYVDIMGNVGVKAYVDSIINFDCNATGWDWAAVDCPYDDTLSIGIRVDHFVYGVVGEAGYLNNTVINRLDVTNRNAAPITDLYLAALNDYDLQANGSDVVKFDAAHSISYGASCAAGDVTNTWVAGMGKIPMDVDPMIGARTLDADQAMWEANYVGLDSIYTWLTTAPGQTAQAGIDMSFPCATSSDDREFFHMFTSMDLAGNETKSVGVYFFEFDGADITDDQYFFDLAIFVNQFAGFGRGDINGDAVVNLADIVALWNMVNAAGQGPLFEHLADVNNDSAVNNGDVTYLANYWFCVGPAPIGDWVLPNICP